MATKRCALESDIDGSNSCKKQKAPDSGGQQVATPQSHSSQSRRQVTTRLDAAKVQAIMAAHIEFHENYKLPDERQEIVNDLDSGSHGLLLEHNHASNAKCRARKCLVKEFDKRWDETIQSTYRINLYATRPSTKHWSQLEKPNRRFFHVSCFEAIGVDIAKYLTLPPPRIMRQTMFGYSVAIEEFHSAITDWVESGGKAFDAELYNGSYSEALKKYKREIENAESLHFMHDTEQCSCAPLPTRPKNSEFIAGEPSACKLINLLFDVLRIGHPVAKKFGLMLLEFHWIDPARLSTSAVNVVNQAESEDQKAGDGEGTLIEKSGLSIEQGSGDTGNAD